MYRYCYLTWFWGLTRISWTGLSHTCRQMVAGWCHLKPWPHRASREPQPSLDSGVEEWTTLLNGEVAGTSREGRDRWQASLGTSYSTRDNPQWENPGTEKLDDLPKVIQMHCGEAEFIPGSWVPESAKRGRRDWSPAAQHILSLPSRGG